MMIWTIRIQLHDKIFFELYPTNTKSLQSSSIVLSQVRSFQHLLALSTTLRQRKPQLFRSSSPRNNAHFRMNVFKYRHRSRPQILRTHLLNHFVGEFRSRIGSKQCFGTHSEDQHMAEFMEYLDSLKNYEKLGVPRGAGTDSDDGFDLGRMTRLMERLGNPQSKFKVASQFS